MTEISELLKRLKEKKATSAPISAVMPKPKSTTADILKMLKTKATSSKPTLIMNPKPFSKKDFILTDRPISTILDSVLGMMYYLNYGPGNNIEMIVVPHMIFRNMIDDYLENGFSLEEIRDYMLDAIKKKDFYESTFHLKQDGEKWTFYLYIRPSGGYFSYSIDITNDETEKCIDEIHSGGDNLSVIRTENGYEFDCELRYESEEDFWIGK